MNSATLQIGFLVVFILIMYLLLIRPQKKREKAVNAMRSSIQVGDEIITIGGICGRVVKTKEESLIIQVGADKVKFEVMRWAISKVVESPGRTAAKKPRPAEDETAEESKKTLPKRMKRAASAETAEEVEAEAETETIEVEAEIVSETAAPESAEDAEDK